MDQSSPKSTVISVANIRKKGLSFDQRKTELIKAKETGINSKRIINKTNIL